MAKAGFKVLAPLEYFEWRIAEFWASVDQSGGQDSCWVWKGSKDGGKGGGYGKLTLFGKGIGTHRFAFALANGRLDPGLEVMHKCDNPPCCNPAHLKQGTSLDNIRDCISKGRDWRGDKSGENNGRAVLTKELVRQIRERAEQRKGLGRKGAAQIRDTLMTDFGVSQTQVYRILRGEQWPDV